MLNFLKRFFAKNYEDLTPEAFAEKIKTEKVVLLDVRTAGEFQQGKIRGARNLDVMNKNFQRQVELLDRNKTYLVYCRSGMRSGRACNMMDALGFENIYNLKGGYMNWRNTQLVA
jgi:rhodanese-related sulfurtransferase